MTNNLVRAEGVCHQGRTVQMVVVEPKSSALRLAEQQCRAFSPLMEIGGNLVNAGFDKIDISRGRVVAYYTGRARIRGLLHLLTARYRVVDGRITLEPVFPVRVK
jgi:hypothetical protein